MILGAATTVTPWWPDAVSLSVTSVWWSCPMWKSKQMHVKSRRSCTDSSWWYARTSTPWSPAT
jgi:hypothetical protein